MSHRIDIELTSQIDSTTWTWRAAGAKMPKGTLDGSLLYGTAKVGDVVRAEAERDLDGVRLLSVQAPKNARKEEAERIELLPVGGEDVTIKVTYADGGRRHRDDDDRPRRDRDGGGRGRPDGPRRDGADRTARPERGPRGRADGARPGRDDRPPRADGAPVEGRTETRARPDDRTRRDRPARPELPVGSGAGRPTGRPDARPRPARINPGRNHRNAFIDGLAPEHRVIAEHLFRGGIPAVRQAIIDQNAGLRAEGKPDVPAAPLLAMADELLPRTKQADWLDRAEAHLAVGDSIGLRDLRSVVAAADGVARDEHARTMLASLKETLAQRVESEKTQWLTEIGTNLDAGRIVQAVRLSSKVPDAAAKVPSELTDRLVAAISAALTADAPPERYVALIEAVTDAPYRKDITIAAVPATLSEASRQSLAQAANALPALLPLLGLKIPPPPRSKPAPGSRPPVPTGSRTPRPPKPKPAPAASPGPAAAVAEGRAAGPETGPPARNESVAVKSVAAPIVAVEPVPAPIVAVEPVPAPIVAVEPVPAPIVAVEPVAAPIVAIEPVTAPQSSQAPEPVTTDQAAPVEPVAAVEVPETLGVPQPDTTTSPGAPVPVEAPNTASNEARAEETSDR